MKHVQKFCIWWYTYGKCFTAEYVQWLFFGADFSAIVPHMWTPVTRIWTLQTYFSN